MAAKVNTRLLLIVVLALGAALAVLGGVYVLKMRGDATRSFRKGEDAFAKADYKTAYDQFGRALGKDPGNPQYLQRVEDSLLRMVPQSANEASEDYTRLLGVMGHAAVHNPTDANAHLRLIKELHSAARRSNDQGSWETLVAAADNMNQRVPDDDPLKPLAKVYKAMGVGRLASSKSDEEIQLALQDLDAAASKLVNNDLAWAAQISARLAWLSKMEVSGKSQTSIDAQREALAAASQRAIESAPQGPETALAYLTSLLIQKSMRQEAVSDDAIRTAAEHLADCIQPVSDPGLINDAASVLQVTPLRTLVAPMLQEANASNPMAYDLQLVQARVIAGDDEYDRAETIIRVILDAPKLPVSFMARTQFVLRPAAASLLGDIEFQRFGKATAEQKAVQLQKLKAARELLQSLSIDATNDPLIIRADAKIAFAQGQYAEAAAKFEQLVQLTDTRDPEMLAFAAASLQQLGQFGLAYERITAALASNPGYIPWIISKAELELRMGRAMDAANTIAPIPDTALADQRTQQIVSLVRRAASAPTSMPTGTDPVQIAIQSAQEAMDRNEPENARAALLAAQRDHSESISLLQALAQVEIRTGNREAAAQFVNQGLKLSPADQILNQLSAGLKFEDPIQATTEYLNATVTDDKQRLNAMLVSMTTLMLQRREAAAQFGRLDREADAKAATDIADRAMTQANASAAELEKIDPDNAQLVEFRFSQALQAQDWDQAAAQVATAKRLNVDVAGGLLFQGRLELARGNTREAIVALESATDKLSFSSYAWRTLAMAYQASGNFAQAERAYEQAYRCNPNDINGARAYVLLLNRRGDKSRALQILRSVHQFSPDDSSLRESWLELEAEVGDVAAALRERTTRYASTPSDRANAAALARLLVTLEPARENMLEENGEPTFNQQRWITLSAVDQDTLRKETRERWSATADKIVSELSRSGGDDLGVAVLKATVLRERGDVTGGEAVLRDFIAQHEKSQQTEEMYIELGRYLANVSHYSEAITTLKDAVAIAGPEQRAAEINLGMLQMQLRQYDEALKAFESARTKRDDPTLSLQIVECLLNLGRLDDAEKTLGAVASGSGGSVATLLQAQIARARGDKLVSQGDVAGADKPYALQRELLAKAEQQDPTNPLPRVLLAQSLIDEYNRTNNRMLLDDALVALDRADRIRAGSPEVSALRVAIQKELGDRPGAIAELQRMLDAAPDNLTARRDLIQMMLESGDPRGAMAVVDDAIRKNPTLAVWHETRGDLLRAARGNPTDVVAAYSAAYERSPSTAILLKLADSMLSLSPPDCRGVVDRLAARDEDLRAEPAVRETYARALMCAGKRDEAIEQLRQAYTRRGELLKSGAMPAEDIARWFAALAAVFPGDQAAQAEQLMNELAASKPNAYEIGAMAGVWMRSGPSGLSRATELQRQAVTLCPAENSDLRAALNSDLAAMLIAGGDLTGAAETYDVVLRLHPTDKGALNNLAFLKAEALNDPAAALPLAVRLLEVASKDPEVLDTVGWVYFKNDDLEKAKLHLNESLAIQSSPETYVHLATVLWKSGDSAGAQQQLAEAEKLTPLPETQQKIKALRDDMGKGGR